MPAFPMRFVDERLTSLVHYSVAQSTLSSHGKAWGEWLVSVGDRQVAFVEEDRLAVTTLLECNLGIMVPIPS